jgi:predicted alpha/beta-fold hydrolase
VITARGGHNGFHSRDHIERLEGGSTVSWADQQTMAWIKRRLITGQGRLWKTAVSRCWDVIA